jgi:hypothetical protein
VHVDGAVERRDGLVQAHRRLEPALQLGMPNEVIVGQRLLDHHEIQRVERGQRSMSSSV